MNNIEILIESVIKEYFNEKKILACPYMHIPKDIENYIKKYKTPEDLLKSGGIPIELLDKEAFGFTVEEITTLKPEQLNIKWKDDLENVKFEILNLQKKLKNPNLKDVMKIWAKEIKLDEPIDVVYEKNKFYIEDGHHRYYAAKILKKPLNVNLEIKMNPIIKMTPTLDYDTYHYCAFNKVNKQN